MMKTILVDDEIWMMRQFEEECAAIDEIEIVGRFTSGFQALEYAEENPVEFALLDIKMPKMNGIELAKKLKELYPEIIVVFVTGYTEYLEDFINIKADYYVLKPYTRADIEDVFLRAKLLSKRLKKRIFIRTFGNFDVFLDRKTIFFNSPKAKELLAYMVDRQGGTLNSKEAFSVIWEDRGEYNESNSATFRKTLKRLRDTLAEAGIGDLILSEAHEKYLNKEIFDCDLYDFLEGKADAEKKFMGEYMSQYSWGESTLSSLVEMMYRKK